MQVSIPDRETIKSNFAHYLLRLLNNEDRKDCYSKAKKLVCLKAAKKLGGKINANNKTIRHIADLLNPNSDVKIVDFSDFALAAEIAECTIADVCKWVVDEDKSVVQNGVKLHPGLVSILDYFKNIKNDLRRLLCEALFDNNLDEKYIENLFNTTQLDEKAFEAQFIINSKMAGDNAYVGPKN